MHTICLFGSDYKSSREVHQALKALLAFPEYYGMNADALNDCLGEYISCPALWVRLDGCDDVQAALKTIMRVFADHEGLVKEL